MNAKYPIKAFDGTSFSDVQVLNVPAGAIDPNGEIDLGQYTPLFGYSNGQSVTSATEVPITGCSVTVENDTFYQADIWIAVDDPSASSGEISTTGTATFTAVLLRQMYEPNGASNPAENGRPATFETTGGGNVVAGLLLHFSGTIQTTAAGTIILNALSINGPGDAFVIDEVRMTLTPIGTV